MFFWRQRKKEQVSFEEILLDASNLPSFNQGRLEGKRELPLTKRNIALVAMLFSLVACLFLGKLYSLQIIHGAEYRNISENNSLNRTTIIAERGVIYDRTGEMLAWNEPDTTGAYSFPVRAYTDRRGLGQVIGYVSYPLKDKFGFYYRTEYLGRNGVEAAFNDVLGGENGQQLVETDAHGTRVAESVVEPASAGSPLTLTVDAGLSEAMYDIIASSTIRSGSRSGAAAIMDVRTGDILAMTSFPSYDPEVMADGDDVALINQYNQDPRLPFLNKVFAGTYTPGSIVKPFVAYAGLKEGIITAGTHISSDGSLTIPNPYTPSQPSQFADWRHQGDMTVREALAFSSNVFFYIVGGGLPSIAVPQAGLSQAFPGLGITKLDHYFDLFGFGQLTGIKLANEQSGTVPSPSWKEAEFGDEWRLGDTYFTSIGQYGWQVTPLQMLVAYGALANGGRFFTPNLIAGGSANYTERTLDPVSLGTVREGMHMTTYYPRGTARSLEKPYVAIAAKSGTAELDFAKARLNTWAAGYWPYDKPRYSFIMMMEYAPYSNRLGGTGVMGEVMDWIHQNRPEYLTGDASTVATSTPTQ